MNNHSFFAKTTLYASIMLAMCLGAGAVQAQNPLGGFAQDANAPIEITADSLEVSQEEELATFTGNVEAIQGTLKLTASILRVNYRAEKSGGNADATGAIRKLIAQGNVFISSPGETARGDWANYDVDQQQITMGDNVVLTQGDSVIKGKSLFIDLKTGKSRIDGGGGSGGRVKGIFTPNSN